MSQRTDLLVAIARMAAELAPDRIVSVARNAIRDGTSPDPSAGANRRYVEGQRIYLSKCSPENHATMVIDNDDLTAPVVVAKI